MCIRNITLATNVAFKKNQPQIDILLKVAGSNFIHKCVFGADHI